jgi:hypothetical protein
VVVLVATTSNWYSLYPCAAAFTSAIRRRNDNAAVAKRRNQAMQSLTRRSGIIAKMNPTVLSRDPLHNSAHALFGSSEASTSPRKRTSPPRLPSAIAAALRTFAHRSLQNLAINPPSLVLPR